MDKQLELKMICTIQIYIHCQTGNEINIVPKLPKERSKLILAYNIAKYWIENNLIKTK